MMRRLKRLPNLSMLISLEHLVGTPKVVILPWDLGAAVEREMTFGEIIVAGEML